MFNKKEYYIVYCDAHFYNVNDPPGLGKFQILKELEALEGMDNVIIIIHDFDNNLGHITYDKISLDFDLLEKHLLKVNPNFKFYTNTLKSCDIVTKKQVVENKIEGLEPDFETLENLDYAWKEPRLTYRGFLYCFPKELHIEGLTKWGKIV